LAESAAAGPAGETAGAGAAAVGSEEVEDGDGAKGAGAAVRGEAPVSPVRFAVERVQEVRRRKRLRLKARSRTLRKPFLGIKFLPLAASGVSWRVRPEKDGQAYQVTGGPAGVSSFARKESRPKRTPPMSRRNRSFLD